MPTTTRRPRSTGPEAPERTLDALRDDLAALLHEESELPTAIDAAMSATDVERWMRLTTRQRDLPAAIHRARVAVIPAAADAAWAAVQPLQAAEDAARRAHRAAQQTADRWSNTLYNAFRPLDLDEQIQRQRDLEEAERTDAALQAARHATSHALHAVDVLEAEHVDLVGEPLPVTRDRPGPRRLATSVTLSRSYYLNDGNDTPEPLPFNDSLTSGAFTLTAGTDVPRWHAHLLGAHVFEPQVATA